MLISYAHAEKCKFQAKACHRLEARGKCVRKIGKDKNRYDKGKARAMSKVGKTD